MNIKNCNRDIIATKSKIYKVRIYNWMKTKSQINTKGQKEWQQF